MDVRALDLIVPGVRRVEVRTPTLPPATHTNCVWLGDDDAIVVVDPASPYEEEQAALSRALDGRDVAAILLSHHHIDHVSGAAALASTLRARGQAAPIWATRETAERVSMPVDRFLSDGEVLHIGHRNWEVLVTPGHAPGHVALLDASDGFAFAADLVAGVGTILLHPDEADLDAYLASLDRLRTRGAMRLLPSHGPVLDDAPAFLRAQIAHREARTQQVRALLALGPSTPEALADTIYASLPEPVRMLGAIQLRTHLAALCNRGEAIERDGVWADA